MKLSGDRKVLQLEGETLKGGDNSDKRQPNGANTEIYAEELGDLRDASNGCRAAFEDNDKVLNNNGSVLTGANGCTVCCIAI